MQTEFWKSSILDWETNRYDSPLSKWLYSSLQHRQKLLKNILENLPAGSSVIELGCGSGRLFEQLENKNNLNYTGVDFSDSAIQLASEKYKNYQNAKWICLSVDELNNYKADYAVSIGLMDWITNSQFDKLINNNEFKFHLHSFSLNELGLKSKLHRLFTSLIRLKNNTHYSPQYFSAEQILDRFKGLSHLKIYKNKNLSFGAFIHNLNENAFSTQIKPYFKKKNQINLIESYYKNEELKSFKKINFKFKDLEVLEIGSGNGFYTKHILQEKPKYLLALDPYSKTPINLRNGIDEFSDDLFETARIDRKFDRIICIGVLEFVNDTALFLEKIISLSRTNTEILIVFPKTNTLHSYFYQIFHLIKNKYTLKKIQPEDILNIFQLNKEFKIEVSEFGPLNLSMVIKKRAL